MILSLVKSDFLYDFIVYAYTMLTAEKNLHENRTRESERDSQIADLQNLQVINGTTQMCIKVRNMVFESHTSIGN